MTRTVGGPIEELRAAMAGVVFTPEDPDYDQARLLWNADADRHPAVVARCSSAADVVAARRLRAGGGSGDRRPVRGAQRVGAERGGRRPGRRPQRDAGGHRRPRAEARPGRRRGVDLGPRRRHPGARAGRADRAGRPHRHRRAHPRRRHGLADPAGRDGLRQRRVGRDRRRRRPDPARLGRGERRPVLGGPRRRRELRGRHRVRVPAARGRADDPVRVPVLGGGAGPRGTARHPRGRRDPAAVVQHPPRGAERTARAVRPRGAPPQARVRARALWLREPRRARAGGRRGCVPRCRRWSRRSRRCRTRR